MAHYLAMKMTEAEKANGKEKVVLEKECFETILQIWNHRWEMSGNSNPLKKFEPILKFLTKFNPNRNDPFYFDNFEVDEKNTTLKKNSNDSWIEIASHFDKYARICIDYALANAAAKLSDEEQLYWIQNTPNLTSDVDITIIKIILDQHESLDLDEELLTNEEYAKRMDVEKLKYNINFLENHQKLHRKLLNDLKEKLTSISS